MWTSLIQLRLFVDFLILLFFIFPLSTNISLNPFLENVLILYSPKTFSGGMKLDHWPKMVNRNESWFTLPLMSVASVWMVHWSWVNKLIRSVNQTKQMPHTRDFEMPHQAFVFWDAWSQHEDVLVILYRRHHWFQKYCLQSVGWSLKLFWKLLHMKELDIFSDRVCSIF